MNGAKNMPQALGADIERRPDRFWSRALSGVSREPQTVPCRVSIEVAKWFGWSTGLVAPNTNSDYVPVFVLHRQLEDPLCRLCSKMTNRIKNPENRDAEVALSPLAPPLDTFK